jgi:hypothetical protein
MSGAAHIDPSNKKIALLIAVLALVLALAETFAKGAQTAALSHNIEASNLWSFFQAKTIRMTTIQTAAGAMEVDAQQASNAQVKEAMEKRVVDWKKTAARYDSEPETKEGRKELMARAKTSEAARDKSLAAYHHYEVGSAAVQVAIVLASAAIITGMTALTWIAGGLGIIGITFCVIGFWWPSAVHLF